VKPSRSLQVAADRATTYSWNVPTLARRLSGDWQPAALPEFWKKTKIITSRELIDLVAPHLGS